MTHLTKTEFHRMAVVDYAHGISHTRPILARGVHFNAANDPQISEADWIAADLQRMKELQERMRQIMVRAHELELCQLRERGL